MTSQHKPIFLFSVALLSIFTMVSSDAILTLLWEHVSMYYTISIKFNETMFSQFYICLCAQKRKECNIRFEPGNQPFQPLAIRLANLNSNQQTHSNYYQCNNNAARQEVQCRRLRVEDMTCKQTNNFTLVPRPSNIACDLTCAGLVWFNPGKESLTYNSTYQSKTKCPDCLQPLSTKTAEPTTVASLLSTKPLSTEELTSVLNESMDDNKNDIENDDNNSIPVIMGVVIGILSIIVLAMVIIFVVRRRKKQNLRKSNKNSTTRTNVSDRRNINRFDDYETVGIEPATSNSASIPDNSRTIPDFSLPTPSPGDDTNNKETESTYINHSHNDHIKHYEVLDNFGYSTIDIGDEVSDGAEKAHQSYENFPEMKSEQPSREMTNATGKGFPEHMAVKKSQQHQQYYNFLTKQDGNEAIQLESLSPGLDLPKSTAGDKTDKASMEYVNSLTRA